MVRSSCAQKLKEERSTTTCIKTVSKPYIPGHLLKYASYMLGTVADKCYQQIDTCHIWNGDALLHPYSCKPLRGGYSGSSLEQRCFCKPHISRRNHGMKFIVAARKDTTLHACRLKGGNNTYVDVTGQKQDTCTPGHKTLKHSLLHIVILLDALCPTMPAATILLSPPA